MNIAHGVIRGLGKEKGVTDSLVVPGAAVPSNATVCTCLKGAGPVWTTSVIALTRSVAAQHRRTLLASNKYILTWKCLFSISACPKVWQSTHTGINMAALKKQQCCQWKEKKVFA